MPYATSLTAQDIVVEIECSTAALSIDTPVVRSLILRARALNAAVAMEKVEFQKKAGTAADFDYTMTARDGRDWNQLIRVEQKDALMNFDVSDMWRLSEFGLQRELRLTLIEMAFVHLAEKVEITWN